MSNGCSLNTYFAGSVGNGSTILFWGDTWIRDVPLRLLYPNLFRLEEDKWVVVNNRMKVINGIKTLVWGWRSEPTSHDEIAELFHLLEDLFNFEWTGGCDTWRWKGDANSSNATKEALNEPLGYQEMVLGSLTNYTRSSQLTVILKFPWRITRCQSDTDFHIYVHITSNTITPRGHDRLVNTSHSHHQALETGHPFLSLYFCLERERRRQ
ncbi:hypothetical protein L1987_19545 [Smallanthus sonchifolius]|uniref:Uncharacterized protein n=1 Tax=Smallanthus sonchifolius TaxID=185202 RepID=A0ACB9IR47_9ASTR|nr:hypothetical protein L1987_19545 [Smallanthus sonchifolius]